MQGQLLQLKLALVSRQLDHWIEELSDFEY